MKLLDNLHWLCSKGCKNIGLQMIWTVKDWRTNRPRSVWYSVDSTTKTPVATSLNTVTDMSCRSVSDKGPETLKSFSVKQNPICSVVFQLYACFDEMGRQVWFCRGSPRDSGWITLSNREDYLPEEDGRKQKLLETPHKTMVIVTNLRRGRSV